MKCDENSFTVIDNSKYIKPNVNSTFGKFPEYFFNNAIGQIPFLLYYSHMNCFKHDYSVCFFTYTDMKLFDLDKQWLNDRFVIYFFTMDEFGIK